VNKKKVLPTHSTSLNRILDAFALTLMALKAGEKGIKFKFNFLDELLTIQPISNKWNMRLLI